MSRLPAIVPITDLRKDAADLLKRVRDSSEPVIITQRGRPAAVVVSLEVYEQQEHERQILRLLVQGEREIAAGAGTELDAVLAAADRVLDKE